MIRVTDSAIMSLMATYAKYFAEDFATESMANLKASYPIDQDYLEQTISQSVSDLFDQSQITMTNMNPVNRFICECATFALEKEVLNPTSREVYNEIKQLTSQHHDEIRQIIFSASELYDITLDKTVLQVVAKEAEEVADLITLKAQERLSSQETGGSVKHFSWGILSDGMWLNKALTRGFEMAKIFRPGADAKPDWVETGFNFAMQHARPVGMDRETSNEAKAAYELLLSHANPVIVAQDVSEINMGLKDLLFTSNALDFSLERYRKAVKDPAALIAAVTDLTSHVTLVTHLKEVAEQLGEDIIPQTLRNRLDIVENSATLALCAFEALRETRYADTLVMCVEAKTEDPMVDVFINKDQFNSYKAAGGIESELIQIGHHLDPRTGRHTPIAGWNTNWVMENKDTIVADVFATESLRLETLRSNDKNVITNLVRDHLRDIAGSYARSCNQGELAKDHLEQINDIARNVARDEGVGGFSLRTETTKLLCDVIGDPFVSRTTNLFVNHATHEDEQVRQNAKSLTIAKTAVYDAVQYFTVDSVYE